MDSLRFINLERYAKVEAVNDEIQELYQELILDHFRHPRCHGCLEHPDAKVDVLNPLCGDEICLTIQLDQGKLKNLGFTGKGCSISQASASMMTEVIKGKSVEEARYLLDNFKAFLHSSEVDADFEDKAGDLMALSGVKKFAARTRCALLAWEALKQAMEKAESESKS